jgi:uncharacterized membrane protein
MKIKEFYHKNKALFFIGIFFLIILIIVLGLIFLPEIFYDQWIWKYYWGPVVADATPGTTTAVHNEIIAAEGYTLISEITYGIILIISIFLIYKLLKKLEIIVDWRFALALLPYILFGPVSRTLEDAGYFSEPVVYWFISPLIYLQIAAYAILFLLLGYYIQKKSKKSFLKINTIIFLGGLLFLIPSSIILIIEAIDINRIQIHVFLLILGIISLIVFFVYIISFYFKNNKKIAVFRNPLNIAMLFGHTMDGVTSYISIKDPFNMGLFYAEKHPASNFLLEIWGPLFPIVKIVLIIIVIYVFDVFYKEELKSYATLVNLLKIGILILGFSPGLRDLLRVAIGV